MSVDEQPQCHKLLNPDSLSTICLNTIALNLGSTIASDADKHGILILRPNQPFLLSNISDEILATFVSNGYILSDREVHMFKDTTKARLSCLDLSNSQVTDSGLEWLSDHPIVSLDISRCMELSHEATQKSILKMAPTLVKLKLGDRAELVTITPKQLRRNPLLVHNKSTDDAPEVLVKLAAEDQLKMLTMHKVSKASLSAVKKFLSSLQNIQYLDLSESTALAGDKGDLLPLSCLQHMPHLHSLVLHNVIPYGCDINIYLRTLTFLKAVRHLDISTANQSRELRLPSVVSQDKALQALLHHLPHLCSLDISGTHLAGLECTDLSENKIAIPGLRGRSFDFLGLLSCLGRPCERAHLPAAKVAGETTIEQVMESLRRYKHRLGFATFSLNNLYTILNQKRAGHSHCAEMLRLTTEAMINFPDDERLTMNTTASLYYLLNPSYGVPDVHTYASTTEIRKAAWVLYTCINEHLNDQSLVRNSLLALCNLRIPEDVAFIYSKMAQIILAAIHNFDSERNDIIHRISLHLLNKMLRGEGTDKLLMGSLGTVQGMLRLIQEKLRFDVADDVISLAWGTLWNITDESPVNCSLFVTNTEASGLLMFRSCYHNFCLTTDESSLETREELLKNMMGLMGNIAEVRSLRPRLTEHFFIDTFSELLMSSQYGFEVSYHAAGILCHILSDDPDPSIWMATGDEENDDLEDDMEVANEDTESGARVTQPTDAGNVTSASQFSMMDESSDEEWQLPIESSVHEVRSCDDGSLEDGKKRILSRLVSAIAGWDLQSERCINYRSFVPILELLQCPHTVEVRHWACWVLCNLTNVYPDRYCKLLRDEGGMQILGDMMTRLEEQTGEVMALAQLTVSKCNSFQSRHNN